MNNSSSLSREDILKQLAQLNKELAVEQDILTKLIDGKTPLELIRQHSFGVTVGLAVTLIAPSFAKASIFDVPVAQGNGPAIQDATKNDLKNYTTAADIDKRLQEKVLTTSQERGFLQNIAVCYALNNKTGYVDKKDGTPRELMNATEVYNQLVVELAKNPNYVQPVDMLPQQKVVYDITFCLQQLGYGQDAQGNIRNFDTKDYIYTNDFVIAIMDFQHDKGIKEDAMAGPETDRHLFQSLQENNSAIVTHVVDTNTIDINIQQPVVTKDTSVVDTVVVDPSTVHIDQIQTSKTDTIVETTNNVVATIDSAIVINKSEVQVTLEKYLIGRELGFIEPTISYLSERKDSAQSLIQEINTIDKNNDPIADKKATLLSILEKYGIKNELVILENEIQLHQDKKDSLILDSLINQKNELLNKMAFTITKPQDIHTEDITTTTDNSSIDYLISKKLPKRGFKKFKNAIVAIVGREPDETSNIEVITWQNLIQQGLLPEIIDMNFDEFSSLKPENFVALLNNNKAKRN